MLKRDLQNVVLLKKIAGNFGLKLAAWSLADTIARRLPFKKLYHITNRARYGKCKEYLIKEYKNMLDEEKKKYASYKLKDIPKLNGDYKIWVFWWQGIENAPQIIKDCVASIKKYSNGHEVVIISKENMEQYVRMPEFIKQKYSRELITLAQLSDILRSMLLTQYGGIWADATLLLTDDITKEKENYGFYTINHQINKDWHICRGMWTGFFLASSPGSPVMKFCRDFLLEYWKRENCLICYLLIDCILSVGYEFIPVIKKQIDAVPVNNEGCFELLGKKRLMPASDREVEEILRRAYIFKLTYKQPYKETVDREGKKFTLFGKIKQRAC